MMKTTLTPISQLSVLRSPILAGALNCLDWGVRMLGGQPLIDQFQLQKIDDPIYAASQPENPLKRQLAVMLMTKKNDADEAPQKMTTTQRVVDYLNLHGAGPFQFEEKEAYVSGMIDQMHESDHRVYANGAVSFGEVRGYLSHKVADLMAANFLHFHVGLSIEEIAKLTENRGDWNEIRLWARYTMQYIEKYRTDINVKKKERRRADQAVNFEIGVVTGAYSAILIGAAVAFFQFDVSLEAAGGVSGIAGLLLAIPGALRMFGGRFARYENEVKEIRGDHRGFKTAKRKITELYFEHLIDQIQDSDSPRDLFLTVDGELKPETKTVLISLKEQAMAIVKEEKEKRDERYEDFNQPQHVGKG